MKPSNSSPLGGRLMRPTLLIVSLCLLLVCLVRGATSAGSSPAAGGGGERTGADPWADRRRRAADDGAGEQPDQLKVESNIANAKVQATPSDMATAAGSHHGKSHGKYYMYAEVPKKHSYKMGFRRGNHKHMIERKESAHKSHVHSHFKWHDKKGKGEHKFEFKHYDQKKKHHHR